MAAGKTLSKKDRNAGWRFRLNSASTILFSVSAFIWMEEHIWISFGCLGLALIYGMMAARDYRLSEATKTSPSEVDRRAFESRALESTVKSPIFTEEPATATASVTGSNVIPLRRINRT